ncbi:MAG: hypothetical protein ACOX4Q_07625 [Syntrophomonadales bacterium]|jgi:hypothetical protein
MSKSETGNEFNSLSQVTIVILLLAVVLMRDDIDRDLIQAICLACLLSLIINEVEVNRVIEPSSDMKSDSAAADSGEEHLSSESDSSSEVLEDFDVESTPDFEDDFEFSTSPGHQKTTSDISNRRPIEVYSSIPSETKTTHNQDITWKPMPPKSIVPTKHLPNKESQSLSIRFVP